MQRGNNGVLSSLFHLMLSTANFKV